jgi:hypothetical protein
VTNNKQQTAVEQLAIALYEGGYLQGNGDEIQNLLEQHLEMEKKIVLSFKNEYDEQQIDALNNNTIIYTEDEYYDITYGGKK